VSVLVRPGGGWHTDELKHKFLTMETYPSSPLLDIRGRPRLLSSHTFKNLGLQKKKKEILYDVQVLHAYAFLPTGLVRGVALVVDLETCKLQQVRKTNAPTNDNLHC